MCISLLLSDRLTSLDRKNTWWIEFENMNTPFYMLKNNNKNDVVYSWISTHHTRQKKLCVFCCILEFHFRRKIIILILSSVEFCTRNSVGSLTNSFTVPCCLSSSAPLPHLLPPSSQNKIKTLRQWTPTPSSNQPSLFILVPL